MVIAPLRYGGWHLFWGRGDSRRLGGGGGGYIVKGSEDGLGELIEEEACSRREFINRVFIKWLIVRR